LRIKKFAKGEFHTWSDQELLQFELKWPIGTTERLAYALLLYTGQRRSDVVAMSWSDVKDGTICITPIKTKRTTAVKLWIPIHPSLQDALDSVEQRGERILLTAYGRPFTSNGFGGFMADKIAKAGLPDRCVTHGLRKAPRAAWPKPDARRMRSPPSPDTRRCRKCRGTRKQQSNASLRHRPCDARLRRYREPIPKPLKRGWEFCRKT
jgi:integrase